MAQRHDIQPVRRKVIGRQHRAIEEPWQEYGGALRVDGATRLRSIRVLLAIARRSWLPAICAGSVRGPTMILYLVPLSDRDKLGAQDRQCFARDLDLPRSQGRP
jgi:hypothetical protein